jgi:hypothetical protein
MCGVSASISEVRLRLDQEAAQKLGHVRGSLD